jgi:peptidoglycan/LPS O-acetylase OafA/YrhL
MPSAWFYLTTICMLGYFGYIRIYPVEIFSIFSFWRNYLHLNDPLAFSTGQFWSLMIEEHFYFFLPAFLLIVREPKKILYWLLTIAIMVAVWRKLGTIDSIVASYPFIKYTMWSTFGRFDGLLYGVLLALIEFKFPQRLNRLKMVSPFVFLAMLILVYTLPIPLKPVFEAILFPLIIFSTKNNDQCFISKILEFRSLKYIGKISYSVYLWQQLFMLQFLAGPEWLTSITGTPYALVPIFVISILNHYYVEDPIRIWGYNRLKFQNEMKSQAIIFLK